MNSSKIFISVSVADLEGADYDKSAYLCDILLNSATIDTLKLGDKHCRSIVPILSPSDRVRFVIKEKKTNYPIGFISFSVKAFLARKGVVLENWITLFDSSNDDEYDGDFTEDDEEDPRVFFRFLADTSANIRKMEESLPEDEKSVEEEDEKSVEDEERTSVAEKNERDLSSNLGTLPPEPETHISGISKITQENEVEISQTLEIVAEKPEQQLFRLQELPKGKEQDEPSLNQSGRFSQLTEKSSEIAKNEKKEDLLVEEGKSYSEVPEDDDEDSKGSPSVSGDEELSATSSDDQESVSDHEESIVKAKETECEGQKNGTQTKEEAPLEEKPKLDAPVEKAVDANKDNLSIEKEDSPTNIIGNEQQPSSVSGGEMPLNSVSQDIHSQNDQTKVIATAAEIADQKDAAPTSESSHQEKAQKATTFEIENERAQNSVPTLKIEGLESSKFLIEENTTLKATVKDLEATIESKTQDLLAMHKRLKEIQDIQKEFEALNTEKHNLKVQNLENTIKNLREELQKIQEMNKELRDDNKSLSIYQSKLLFELNKLNEDHLHKYQKISQENADMKAKLQTLEKKLLEKDQVITDHEKRMEACSVKITSLEGERNSLEAKLTEMEKAAVNQVAGESITKMEESAAELAKLTNDLAERDFNNSLLKREIETLRGGKAQLETELEQIKSRNYEHKIKKLQKKVHKREKETVEVREELLQAQKKHSNILSEQESRFVALKAEKDLEIQNLRAEKEGQDKEIKNLQDENQELKASFASLEERLKSTSDELASYQDLNSEQRKTIQLLTNKLQSLEKSLKNAFEDIQKLETSIGKGSAGKGNSEANKLQLNSNFNNTTHHVVPPATKSMSSSTKKDSKSKNGYTEIDAKLDEFLKENKLPIKFEKLTDRVYTFGSKRVRMKIIDGKLAAKVGGGYVYIESFIKMYASHELNKLKISKENITKPEGQVDNATKETDGDEDGYLHTEVKSKSKERPNLPIKLQNLHATGSGSIQTGATSSQKSDRSTEPKKESAHRTNKSFKFDGFQSVAKGNEGDRMVVTLAEEPSSNRRRAKQTEEFYFDISPNYKTQIRSGKSSNRASNDLNNDDIRKKSPIEQFALRREKSPIDYQRNRIESMQTNSRDISPYQKNTIPKIKTNKELLPIYHSSSQKQ